MNTKKNRLGRGLETLVSIDGLDKLMPQKNKSRDVGDRGVPLQVPVNMIDRNPDQPRRDFNEKELQSLSQSIKSKGIIEPLIVTKKEDGRFELVAGERRLKAASLASLNEVPVIIIEISEDNSDRLVLALLENICREDLNPIEEAESFWRLEKEFGKTHQEIAVICGRERPTITNAVRLLKLPDFVQEDIRFNRLSAGHGRALLGLSDPGLFHQLRAEVVGRGLTVRQTEALVKKLNRKPVRSLGPGQDEAAYFEALSKSFSDRLGGLKVRINHSGSNKKLEIFYNENEELELLMNKLGVKPV